MVFMYVFIFYFLDLEFGFIFMSEVKETCLESIHRPKSLRFTSQMVDVL